MTQVYCEHAQAGGAPKSSCCWVESRARAPHRHRHCTAYSRWQFCSFYPRKIVCIIIGRTLIHSKQTKRRKRQRERESRRSRAHTQRTNGTNELEFHFGPAVYTALCVCEVHTCRHSQQFKCTAAFATPPRAAVHHWRRPQPYALVCRIRWWMGVFAGPGFHLYCWSLLPKGHFYSN